MIAAELCSLTFQKDDQSKSNLIGTSLFGDGIAALLMCGKEADFSEARFEVLPEVLGVCFDQCRNVPGKNDAKTVVIDFPSHDLFRIFQGAGL